MQEKQQRAVGDARQARAETSPVAHILVLFADSGLDFLPLHAKWGIRQHVIEAPASVAVIGQGIPGNDVGHILSPNQHIRLAGGVGLVVEFLAEHGQAGVGVEGVEVFPRHGEHPPGAGGGVIEGADDAALGQYRVVFGKQQFHHQVNDFPRRKVFSGRLVGHLRETPEEFLEEQAHLVVAEDVGVQVEAGEFLGDEIQQPRLVQPLDGGGKIEAGEDVLHVRGKGPDSGLQVMAQVIGVTQQPRQVLGEEIEKGLPGRTPDEFHKGQFGRGFCVVFGEGRRPRGGEHAVETPEDGKGQNHPSIFRLLEVAPEQVGHGPDECGDVLLIHGNFFSFSVVVLRPSLAERTLVGQLRRVTGRHPRPHSAPQNGMWPPFDRSPVARRTLRCYCILLMLRQTTNMAAIPYSKATRYHMTR